jgi:hypothetical protein
MALTLMFMEPMARVVTLEPILTVDTMAVSPNSMSHSSVGASLPNPVTERGLGEFQFVLSLNS